MICMCAREKQKHVWSELTTFYLEHIGENEDNKIDRHINKKERKTDDSTCIFARWNTCWKGLGRSKYLYCTMPLLTDPFN